jgi:hypothetical protein
MASCFEVSMALAEGGFIQGEDLDAVTTILVETLLATGTIKERSQAVEDKSIEDEIYTAAEYTAAANDAVGDFEDEIRQAEIMLDARERKMSHEEIIIEADALIGENARLATATLVEKGLADNTNADQVRELIAQAWTSTEE